MIQTKNRLTLCKLASDHTQLMQKNYANEIKECVESSKIYDKNYEFKHTDTQINHDILLTDTDSASAVLKYAKGKTCLLNFASFKHPGGGFMRGSMAQEEAICHESFLYNILTNNKFKDYYEWNNNNLNKALYYNRAIYSNNVYFFGKNKIQGVDVITCACPNKGAAMKNGVTSAENSKVLYDRIKFVISIMEENNIETAILGAYGCGVFKQNPAEVAQIFNEIVNKSSIKNIIYAIIDKTCLNYREFDKVINR